MDDNKLRFGVGVLVVSAIGVGILLTFLFGAFPSVLKDDYELSVVFESAEGINANSPVLRDGVKIGRVKDIQLLEEGGVLVRLSLDSGQKLTHRYVPQISTGNLVTGDSDLEFVKANPQRLASIFRDRQEMIDQPYTDAEFLDYGDTSESLMSIQGDLSETLATFRAAGNSINRAGDAVTMLAGEVRQILGGVTEDGAGEFKNVAAQAVDTLEELQAAIRDVRSIVGDPALKQNIDQSADQLPGLLTEAGEALRSTQRTFERFERVGDQFESAGQQFNQAGETVQDAIAEAREGIDEIRDGVDEIRQGVGDAREGVADARVAIKRFQRSADGVDRAVAGAERTFENLTEFTQPLADNGDQFAAETLAAIRQLRGTLWQAEQFAEALNNSDGTIRQLLDDDSLYREIRRTVANIELASARLRPILDDVRIFSDKIARDPRQLGVRGALTKRPNQMGLK